MKNRIERKKKSQQRKLRQEEHLRQSLAGAEDLIASSRLAMERVLGDVQKVLEGHEFANDDELNRFLSKLTGTGLEKRLAGQVEKDPARQAQDLAYQAMEAETASQAVGLARKAVALDPDCVDALAVIARETAQSLPEAIALLTQAVEAGERSLGANFFEENKGHFWGILETRPYMRARHELAGLLRSAGRLSESIRHIEAILELNPNDNQGVRDDLLGCYLSTGNLEGARRLLKRYEEDCSAVFGWGRVLERYLSGDIKAASQELKRARADNRYAEAYLTGKKRVPRRPPDFYSFGDESEAICCAILLADAWKRHPQAIEWLTSAGKSKSVTA